MWSDRGGLYARGLDPAGRPTDAARRLGASCEGGLATALDGERAVIACARRGDPDRDRPGSVALLDDAGATLATFGPVGLGDANGGVSVAAQGGRVVVGYRDVDGSSARAMVADLIAGEPSEPRAISSEGTHASAPALAFVGSTLHMAWTESWLNGDAPTGHLLAQREGDPPRPSLRVSGFDVRTSLAADGERAIVTLRDQRPRGASFRSFTGHLDEALRLEEDHLHSPSRADAPEARPEVLRCGEHRFSVATRQSSRGVTMVTLRRLGPDLDRAEDEQQIYEYHRRFPLAAAACVDDQLLVLVGERQTERQPTPRLTTYALRCAPGREHARTPP